MALYLGEGQRALQRIREAEPLIEGAFMTRILVPRILLHASSARAALLEVFRGTPGALAVVTRDIDALGREQVRWGRSTATLLRACLSVSRGDDRLAASQLQEAEIGFEADGMVLHACAARKRRGQLLGGREGARLATSADALVAEKGVANPARMIDTLAPVAR